MDRFTPQGVKLFDINSDSGVYASVDYFRDQEYMNLRRWYDRQERSRDTQLRPDELIQIPLYPATGHPALRRYEAAGLHARLPEIIREFDRQRAIREGRAYGGPPPPPPGAGGIPVKRPPPFKPSLKREAPVSSCVFSYSSIFKYKA